MNRPGFAASFLHGGHMAAGQVHHMDVVTHAGAVGRGVIVAEDMDASRAVPTATLAM